MRGRHLLLAADLQRAAHRERGAGARVVDRHQRAAGPHLRIVRDLVHRPDHAEGDAGRLQHAPPLRPVALGEDRVEDGDERAHVGAAGRRRGEARVGEQVRPADGRGEVLPAPAVGRERDEEPAAVATAVEVAQRVDRLLARRPHHGARAAEDALGGDRVQPEAVGHQRRGDHRAAPRPLALVERGHDRAEQRRPGGVIAHAGQRARGRRVRRGRTRSISPVRAHSAVLSKPGRLASSPVSP